MNVHILWDVVRFDGFRSIEVPSSSGFLPFVDSRKSRARVRKGILGRKTRSYIWPHYWYQKDYQSWLARRQHEVSRQLSLLN